MELAKPRRASFSSLASKAFGSSSKRPLNASALMCSARTVDSLQDETDAVGNVPIETIRTLAQTQQSTSLIYDSRDTTADEADTVTVYNPLYTDDDVSGNDAYICVAGDVEDTNRDTTLRGASPLDLNEHRSELLAAGDEGVPTYVVQTGTFVNEAPMYVAQTSTGDRGANTHGNQLYTRPQNWDHGERSAYAVQNTQTGQLYTRPQNADDQSTPTYVVKPCTDRGGLAAICNRLYTQPTSSGDCIEEPGRVSCSSKKLSVGSKVGAESSKLDRGIGSTKKSKYSNPLPTTAGNVASVGGRSNRHRRSSGDGGHCLNESASRVAGASASKSKSTGTVTEGSFAEESFGFG
jgi:hypothetical protein